jgi:uncharacterized membrane protein
MINSEASMKIYDHIQCTCIIQNLIFFIIKQGRALYRRETLKRFPNRYNDSIHILKNILSSL